MSLQLGGNAAAAWKLLGLGRWEEEGVSGIQSSDHCTSASASLPIPVLLRQALAPAYHDIASYETKGIYSCPKLLSKIIIMMNTGVRG